MARRRVSKAPVNDLGVSRAPKVPMGIHRVSVSHSAEMEDCRTGCPSFEGDRDDPDFFKMHAEKLKRCFELGGPTNMVGQDLIICPVDEPDTAIDDNNRAYYRCKYTGEMCNLMDCHETGITIRISPASSELAESENLDVVPGYETGFGIPGRGRETASIFVCEKALEQNPSLFDTISHYESKGR